MDKKLEKSKKLFYITKNVNPKNLKIIKENFEDPTKYLSLDPQIRVGLLPFKSKKSQINRKILSENLDIYSNNINEITNQTREKRPKSISIPNKINIKIETNDILNNNKRYSQQITTNKNNKIRISSSRNRKNGPILSSARMPQNNHIHYELKSKDELLKIFSDSKKEKFLQTKSDLIIYYLILLMQKH